MFYYAKLLRTARRVICSFREKVRVKQTTLNVFLAVGRLVKLIGEK